MLNIDVTTITQAGVVRNVRTYVHMFEWHPGAKDQDLLIKNAAGKILYQVRSAGAAPNGESQYVEWKKIGGVCNGVTVETIGGGTLHMYTG